MIRLFLLGLALFGIAIALSGCSPVNAARITITSVDVLNARAPRIARPIVKSCIDKSVEEAKSGKPQAAAIDLDGCEKLRNKIADALKKSVLATDTAAAGVDIAEAAGQKDFSAIIAPMQKAADDLKILLQQAGGKVQ